MELIYLVQFLFKIELCIQHLCLYEFAAEYAPKTQFKDDSEELDYNGEPEEGEAAVESRQRLITLKNNKGKMYKRTKSAVVRWVNFDQFKEPDNYYYSQILLFLPFREENFCENRPHTLHSKTISAACENTLIIT